MAERKQGLYWILTIPHDKWEQPLSLPDWANCLMGQLEIGESGYRHWQLLVALKKKTTATGVKKLFCNEAHVELSRSAAAKQYVHKEETAVAGTRFQLGDYALKRNDKDDWNKLRDLAKTDGVKTILEEYPELGVRYYNTWKNIGKDFMQKPPNLEDVCGIWIWGPPGVGKTRKAEQDYPNAFPKNANKWWDGYQGEDNVILDDLDHAHKCLGTYLKHWADYKHFIAETKGFSCAIRPKQFIVTSNYTIEDIFAGDTPLVAALKRRFKVIHCPLPMVKKPKVENTIVDLVSEIEHLPDWDDLGFMPSNVLAPQPTFSLFNEVNPKFLPTESENELGFANSDQ